MRHNKDNLVFLPIDRFLFISTLQLLLLLSTNLTIVLFDSSISHFYLLLYFAIYFGLIFLNLHTFVTLSLSDSVRFIANVSKQ